MEQLEYHEGKPSLLMTGESVVILCPHRHVVEVVPAADWARSRAEATMDKTVRCCGTIR